MKRTAAALALAAALGCIPRATFVPTESPYENREGEFTVDLPEGWMRVNSDQAVVVTRDGLALQRIFIGRHELGKPLKNSKRTIAAGMDPHEIAEALTGEFSSNEGLTGVQIQENSPAKVSGARGLKIVFAYKDSDGLRMRSVFYGVLAKSGLWYVGYAAPARHYFSADLATFEKVVRSFKLAAPDA